MTGSRFLRGENRWLRLGAVVVSALLLLGIGAFIGVTVRGSAGQAGAGPATASGSAGASGARVIDMTEATGASCEPPVQPGPGHPETLLSQIFNVKDGQHTAYLLGWQIVPYRGAHTYSFGSAGNLLALEPPTGGRPVGFGSGTVTFSGSADTGTVDALVKLTAGGTLSVTGNWVCSITGQAPAKKK